MEHTEPLARVLVLDSPQTGTFYCKMHRFDIMPDLAYSLKDALSMAYRNNYDAFLADVEDFADPNLALVVNAMGMNVPIIALSDGNSPIKDIKSANEYAFKDYLVKPFDIEDAVQAVASCIERSKDSNHNISQYVG